MARTIAQIKDNNFTVVMGISQNMANEIYDNLKQTDEQLAIFFMEQWRYARITGHLMVA